MLFSVTDFSTPLTTTAADRCTPEHSSLKGPGADPKVPRECPATSGPCFLLWFCDQLRPWGPCPSLLPLVNSCLTAGLPPPLREFPGLSIKERCPWLRVGLGHRPCPGRLIRVMQVWGETAGASCGGPWKPCCLVPRVPGSCPSWTWLLGWAQLGPRFLPSWTLGQIHILLLAAEGP